MGLDFIPDWELEQWENVTFNQLNGIYFDLNVSV